MTSHPAKPSSSMSQSDPMTRTVDLVHRVAGAMRAAILIRRFAVLIAGIVAALLLLGSIDWLLRIPTPGRVLLMAALIATVVVIVLRYVRPAWRFHPNTSSVAQRIERTVSGDAQRSGSTLASALELARHAPDDDDTGIAALLHSRTLARAASEFAHVRLTDVVELRPAMRACALLLFAVIGVGAVSLLAPGMVGTGAKRLLTPWSDTQWPRRQIVEDITTIQVHPIDVALPIRAAVTRTNKGAGETPVAVNIRVSGTDQARRFWMTSQTRTVQTEGGSSGELYERLVEPASLSANADTMLRYWIETEDDRTVTRQVRLVQPPAILGARAVVTPPDYASASGSSFASGEIDLGLGRDERAVLSPVLAGSRVRLSLTLNKPIDPAASPDNAIEWARSANVWHASFVLSEPRRIAMDITDKHGIGLRDDAVYTFDVVNDNPPAPVVVVPAVDESVLASAAVPLLAAATDDIGLESLRLVRSLRRASDTSARAQPDPLLGETIAEATGNQQTRTEVAATLDMAVLGVRPGDEIIIHAIAQDVGEADAPTVSQPRRLRIISETELVEQLRAQLAGVRRSVVRLDEQAAAIERGVAEQGISASVADAQARLAERIREQAATVQRLGDRQRANDLQDPGLDGLIRDAESLLESAAESADQAAQSASQEEDPQTAERETRDAQDETRRDLGRVLELLDRGEDGWLVRRMVERLRDSIARAAEETAQAGEGTAGQSVDDLSVDQRSELQRLADRQEELAQQAEEIIDELTERAQQLRESDPVQAEAMREAASRARRASVAEQLREAAGQTEQNQTSEAGESQQAALEGLDEVLEELEEAGQRRDEVLRRILASIADSIDGLIAAQEVELAALVEAGEAGPPSARGMIVLNRNTLGVLDQAESGLAELRAIADQLRIASTAQQSAIEQLRADPFELAPTLASERESLAALIRARAEAAQAAADAEQREQDRVRAELRQAYRAALEEQVVLKGDAEPFVDQQLGRRERAAVRGIGQRQDELRARIASIPQEYEDLADAPVVSFTHDRIDRTLSDATADLQAGTPRNGTVQSQQAAIDLLSSLLTLLSPQNNNQDDFGDGGAGEGGGGGGTGGGGEETSPLVPELAELQLLRTLQEQIARLTVRADGEPDESRRRTALDDLAEFQRQVGQQAAQLIQRINRARQQPQQEPIVPSPESTDEEPEGSPS